MADQKWYDEGMRPWILINWQSFVDRGISNDWQAPFTDAVINAYTRWMNVAGVDLRFRFWGYTTQTNANPGELVISMNDFHDGESRLASTFGLYNQLIIIFHRGDGADPDHGPWPFVPFNAIPGEIDMQGVLMHELGHCLGLDHSTAANDTMRPDYDYHSARYGPFENDVTRLRSVYSTVYRNRLRQLRSTDAGSSWTEVSNALTSSADPGARTNLNPGVVATPPSGIKYVLGWSLPGNAPTWLRNDGESFMFRPWIFYGGERQIYGPTFARDDRRTMLWAWVTNDDQGTIKVVRSDDDGFGWYGVGVPAGAQTFGVPALCWTRVGGRSTWILVWSHFDRGDHRNTGYLRYSLSTDDGWSWSAPTFMDTFYRALSGVTAAADASNHIEVAFAWAPYGTYGMNLIRTLTCQVTGGRLALGPIIYGTYATRNQPSLAYNSSADKFILAWREQNAATSLNVASRSRTALSWSPLVRPGPSSHVAPSLAFSPAHNETVLWYAYE